jgi:hypothetical protein
MKSIMVINTVSIILGIVALAYKSLTYTKQQEDQDIGLTQASLETKKTVPLSPLWGGLALASRMVLVTIGIKAKE